MIYFWVMVLTELEQGAREDGVWGMAAATGALSPEVNEVESEPGCGYEGVLSPEVSFSVATAKRPGKDWDQDLQVKVAEARDTYRMVGDSGPLREDGYDPRAYVYLTQVNFLKGGVRMSEYATVRLVKASADPQVLTEDLLYYTDPDGTPIFEVMRGVLALGEGEEAARKVGNLARFGGKRAEGQPRNWFAAVGYSLAMVQAVRDARVEGMEYLVHQLNPELRDKNLCVGGRRLDFKPAEEVVGVPAVFNTEIPAAWRTATHYPGYFFNNDDLRKLLYELVQDGRLPIERLGIRVTGLEDIVAMEKRDFTNLIPMFSQLNGEMVGPGLTGDEMRSLLKTRVRTAPFLSISPIGQWEETVQGMVGHLHEFYQAHSLREIYGW